MSFDKGINTPTIQLSGVSKTPMDAGPVAHRNKTWRDAEGQKETSVPLDRLPANLAFPDNFPEPITYDPGRKLLKYRGLMFSGSYAYLRKLSADPAFLAALDQLFIGTSCPAARAGRWALAVVAAVSVALAAFAAWWIMR